MTTEEQKKNRKAERTAVQKMLADLRSRADHPLSAAEYEASVRAGDVDIELIPPRELHMPATVIVRQEMTVAEAARRFNYDPKEIEKTAARMITSARMAAADAQTELGKKRREREAMIEDESVEQGWTREQKQRELDNYARNPVMKSLARQNRQLVKSLDRVGRKLAADDDDLHLRAAAEYTRQHPVPDSLARLLQSEPCESMRRYALMLGIEPPRVEVLVSYCAG